MSFDRQESNVFARQRCSSGWAWFFVFAATSLIIQWPLVISMTTHISYGFETDITVPLLNLWTVWWNADRAGDAFRGYGNAPIFFPTHGAFAFSEMQPTSVIVAPIIGLTGNRALAYNVYQLLILTLNGFSSFQLFRRIGHIPWLAFCGGIMSQILPFVIWQFGVVQLTTLFGIYWTVHAVLNLFGTASDQSLHSDAIEDADDVDDEFESSVRRFPVLPSICLGLAFGLTYWLCNYWGLFLFVLMIPSSVWLWNRRLFEKRFWCQLGLAALTSAVMVAPFVWLQCSLSREHLWQSSRTQDVVHDLSACWQDYTDVPWFIVFQWLEFPEPARANVWMLGSGGFKLLLIPLGFVAAVSCRQRRRWGLFVITFGALALGLSLGPTVQFSESLRFIGGFCPYELLQRWFPGFSLIRSPFRFALFVQIASVWLSVEALDLLNPSRWMRIHYDDDESNRRYLPSILNPLFDLGYSSRITIPLLIPLMLASVFATIEAVPGQARLYQLPSSDPVPEWVSWMRDKAKPNEAVACLPFPVGYYADVYEETAIWMYWSTFHRHPLVNGYSGFFPDSFIKIKDGLEQFENRSEQESNENVTGKFSDYADDNPGLIQLNEIAFGYLVVKRSIGTPEQILLHPVMQNRWLLVLSDENSEIDIYERVQSSESAGDGVDE